MKILILILFSSVAFAQTEVLTSFSILESVTKEIAPSKARVSSLVPEGQDWHSYKMTARDGIKVQKATLVLYWGLGLDQALEDLVKRKDFKNRAVQVTQGLPTLKGHQDDHNHHHHEVDPHLWQDSRLMVLMVKGISKVLIETFPESKSEIETKTKSYVSKLEDIYHRYKIEFDQLPENRKTILTSHQAFNYLGDEMGLKIVSLQGLDSEMDPTIKQMQKLKKRIQSKEIYAVFHEVGKSSAMLEKVAGRKGSALYSDSLGAGSNAKSYLQFIEYNFKTILEDLKK